MTLLYKKMKAIGDTFSAISNPKTISRLLLLAAVTSANTSWGYTLVNYPNLPRNTVNIRWMNPIDTRFLTVDVGPDNLIHAEFDKGEAFEATAPLQLSQDKTHILLKITRRYSNHEQKTGSAEEREINYCAIYNTNTTCLIAKKAGRFCTGEFTINGNTMKAQSLT